MNRINHPTAAVLDGIRKNRGTQACREFFQEYEKKGRAAALKLADDPSLTFGTFFVLLPEIRRLQMQEELGGRARTACRLCETILSGQKTGMGVCPSFDGGCQDALLWIFLTGMLDDGMDGDFDRIIDTSAAVLAKNYHNESFLPDLVSLIFSRNRKGGYVHDLAWAFLQSRSPKALRLAADYLRSNDERDTELAEELLHLPHAENGQTRQEQYASYLKWLEENGPYLLFGCIGFNGTSQPDVCRVDLAAKYLGKTVADHRHEILGSLSSAEESVLSGFEQMRDDEKETLAHFSALFHRRNPGRWKRWMRSPTDVQLNIAKNGGRDGR